MAWLPKAQAVGFIAHSCLEGSFMAVGTEGEMAARLKGGQLKEAGSVCWGDRLPSGARRDKDGRGRQAQP